MFPFPLLGPTAPILAVSLPVAFSGPVPMPRLAVLAPDEPQPHTAYHGLSGGRPAAQPSTGLPALPLTLLRTRMSTVLSLRLIQSETSRLR